DNAFEVAAIEAHFTQSLLVPSLLQTFNPSALLTLTYAGTVGKTTPGQALTIDQVKPYPELAVTAANSSVNLSGNFTIAMVDADIVGSNGTNVTRHWLVNGVTVNGTSINNSSATAITDYASPYPAEGSGAHRYVILLFAQPNSFSPPSNLSSSGSGPIEKYDVIAYAKESGLGAIVAATYITVEQGTSTMSVPATSPVMTSTLAVATVSGPSVSGS
ncbi:PEBP-like protein, partial [Fistulina hepatica ATCC 64428]